MSAQIPNLLLKAAFYACSSGPKIAAPHRFSLHGDYELCVLTSFSSIKAIDRLLYRLELFLRGEVALGDIGLGFAMSEAISHCLRDIGAKLNIEIALSIPLATTMIWLRTSARRSLSEAVNVIIKALQLSQSVEGIQLVSILRNLGAELALYLEEANLSERRIKMEGLSVYDVLIALSRVSRGRFSFIENLGSVVALVSSALRGIEDGVGINEVLTRVFIDVAHTHGYVSKIDVPKTMSVQDIVRLLKLDNEFRKRGVYLAHLLPYVLLVATELAIQGF